MTIPPFSLGEVLAVAEIHPFYKEEIQYPPEEKIIRELGEKVSTDEAADKKLNLWPITWKKNL
jgi:hypothetical protein